MALREMVTYLLEEGYVIVATSNRPPDELLTQVAGEDAFKFFEAFVYKMQEACPGMQLTSSEDYRRRVRKLAPRYLYL